MTRVRGMVGFAVAVFLVPVVLVRPGMGWGNDGHQMINRLAAAALPKDVPEFLRSPAAQEAMAKYSGQWFISMGNHECDTSAEVCVHGGTGGTDTWDVLRRLAGLDDAEIAALVEDRVVAGARP